MVNINKITRISTRIDTGAVTRLVFGRGLLITTDELIPASGTGKARLFENYDAAVDYFAADSDALAGLKVWFQADPQPQGIYCGRWADVDVPTRLRGATPETAAAIVGNAASTFTIGTETVAVDLSSVTTFAGIASAIETAIVALTGIYAAATFDYLAEGVFQLELAGADALPDPFFGNTAAATDVDIAALLGMAEADSPLYLPGSTAESLADALVAMRSTQTVGERVGIMLADDVPATDPSVPLGTTPASFEATWEVASAYAETKYAVFALLETDRAALITGDTTSNIALALVRSRGNTFAAFADDGQRPDIAGLAAMSAQNLAASQSIISLQGKTFPGVEPTVLTDVQYDELKRKRASVYTNVLGAPTLLGGYTSRDGHWLDAVWWLIWLRNEIQVRLWTSIRDSRRFTAAILSDTLLQAMQAGVRNGGIQPGRPVDAGTKADIIRTTGNEAFDGTLVNGYLVFILPRAQSEIDARTASFKAWVYGSDAIHEIDGDVSFRN